MSATVRARRRALRSLVPRRSASSEPLTTVAVALAADYAGRARHGRRGGWQTTHAGRGHAGRTQDRAARHDAGGAGGEVRHADRRRDRGDRRRAWVHIAQPATALRGVRVRVRGRPTRRRSRTPRDACRRSTATGGRRPRRHSQRGVDPQHRRLRELTRPSASRGGRASAYAGRIDGVHAFAHPYGCTQLGDDLKHTQAVLAGLDAPSRTPAAC